MQRIGRSYAAVRDADVGPDAANGIFSFPGDRPPEWEVYQNAAVQGQLQAEYGVNAQHVFTQRQVTDHHEYTAVLADETSTPADYMATFAIRCYLDGIGVAAFQPLITSVQARMP